MKVEKDANAQLGRSFEFSLPKEWSRTEQIEYATDFIQRNFVAKGMCADWSIHDKGDGNPHVHLLVTMRPFKKDHTWGNKEVKDWAFVRDKDGNIVIDETHPDWWQDKKNPERHGIRIPVLDANGNQKLDSRNRKQWKREVTDATGWNNPKNCELWRSEWAKECNLHLKQEQQIDHRSYKRQGKIEIPTIHEGADARKIEEKYQSGQAVSASWKVEENRMLKDENQQWKELTEKWNDENRLLQRQNEESLNLCEKLNSENRAENIQALKGELKQTKELLQSEKEKKKRADNTIEECQDKLRQAEREKEYALTHQKKVEIPVENPVLYERCRNCDRKAYQQAKERYEHQRNGLEKEYKAKTVGFDAMIAVLWWYAIVTTIFAAMRSEIFLGDFTAFVDTIWNGICRSGKWIVDIGNVLAQVENRIPNEIFAIIVHWLLFIIVIAGAVGAVGVLIVIVEKKVIKVYQENCWDVISVGIAVISLAVAVYFGDWIKVLVKLNLVALLLLVQAVYVGIRVYVKGYKRTRGYY